MRDPHLKILNILQVMAETVPVEFRGRLAAAVVHRNEILSFGVNQMKSHPFQRQYSSNEDSIYLHAETDAIKNALKKHDIATIAKSKLYICRVKYDNEFGRTLQWGLSKPCAGCQKAIATFNIKHVCYTTDDGYNWL